MLYKMSKNTKNLIKYHAFTTLFYLYRSREKVKLLHDSWKGSCKLAKWLAILQHIVSKPNLVLECIIAQGAHDEIVFLVEIFRAGFILYDLIWSNIDNSETLQGS